MAKKNIANSQGDENGQAQPSQTAPRRQIWVYLATLLRERGFDVYHVTEVGLDHTPDPEILQEAVKNHRAVVTFNTSDFIPLAREYSAQGKEHYGIVVSNEIPQGELQRRVTKLLESVSADDLKNIVRFLQEFKQE